MSLRCWALSLSLVLTGPALGGDITVFAAASLKTALDQVAADWQAETGHSITISYAGTPQLAQQILAGAPADLFLSASKHWMDTLDAAGAIDPATRRDLWGNTLVLVAGPEGAAGPVTLDAATDLAGLLAGGKLSMALVDAVPAGQYGKEALESLCLWASVAPSVVQSENVRVALDLVIRGEAALGVVYGSDAAAAPQVHVVGTFPASSHGPITFPGAVTAEAADPVLAAAFLDYLAGPLARQEFLKDGFALIAP